MKNVLLKLFLPDLPERVKMTTYYDII